MGSRLFTAFRQSLRLLVPILFLTASSMLGASSAPAYLQARQLFQEANQAYQNGQYQQALEKYQQILSLGLESAELYYNLGNCSFKLGRIGQAVLFYRKAALLNPDDEEIQVNLQLARTRVVDRIELPEKFILFRWWEQLTDRLTMNRLAWWLAIAYATFAGFLGLRFLVQSDKAKTWMGMLAGSAAIVTLLILLLFWALWQKQHNQQEGVVLAKMVHVQSAPGEEGTDLFILHEGTEVQVEQVRQQWAKIKLVDGKAGWVPLEEIGMI